MAAENTRITLQEGAIRAGTAMGLFWIVKFAMIPMGFTIPVLHLLFIFLTVFVPFLGYIYAKRYRNKHLGGSMRYGQGFAFCLIMYIAATMLAFMGHYVYFRYLDNGFLMEAYRQQLELLSEMTEAENDLSAFIEQSAAAFDEVDSLSAVEKTFRMAWQNLMIAVPLAAVTAIFTRKTGQEENDK